MYDFPTYDEIHKPSLPKTYLHPGCKNIMFYFYLTDDKFVLPAKYNLVVESEDESKNIIKILGSKSSKYTKYISAKSYQEKVLIGNIYLCKKNTKHVYIGETKLYDICLRRIANKPFQQLNITQKLLKQLVIQFGYGCILTTTQYTFSKDSCGFSIKSNEIYTDGTLGWKIQISIDHNQLAQAWDLIVPLIVKHKVPGGKMLRKEYLDIENNIEENRLCTENQGKEITLYAFLNLKKNWRKMLNDIEKILIKHNIKPNKHNGNKNVLACRSVKGSRFFSYRCDYFLDHRNKKKYIEADKAAKKAGEINNSKKGGSIQEIMSRTVENDEQNAYNPGRVVDPFDQLEIISEMHYGLRQSLFAVQPSNANQQINSTPSDCKITYLENL